MKIKTKLLVALGTIALFPAIAAYVVLVGNPRISFALRMNEDEARQGFIAQRLQSELNAMGAALQESLGDSYRVGVVSKDHDEADRQRKVANDKLQSLVAVYEVDLGAIIDSQQEQNSSSAVDRLAEVERREAELLRELSDALPDLKSNAAHFVQLSNGGSPTEAEFARTVFGPELQHDLNGVVQDLANVSEEGAEFYRRNIETELRASYKQTVLIVLLGLACSAFFAAAVSRGVIQPIREIRDASVRLGQGHLDTKIVVRSADELGDLAGSFNRMADSLTALMTERSQAQEELVKAHEKLKDSVSEVESRNREALAMSEMADLLQSCFTLEEASGVIASSAQKLFSEYGGSMFVFSASRNVLEAITTWGPMSAAAERIFGPSDCWALRRGRLHQSRFDEGAIRCGHLGADSRVASLCTPLMAHGETLGVLCLTAPPADTAGAVHSAPEFNVNQAASLAEQAALAFANLKLREKLRQQSVRDPLTGLFNRRYLEESLEKELPRAFRGRRSVGVIIIDVDHFKRFNDLFGHDAGDTVLREFGDYLAKFTRRGDVACRYGGEEFVLVLPESSLEDTRLRAEEMRMSFQQLTVKHREMVLGKVTLSAGVAAFPEHGSTSAELLTAADGALLRAKEAGRDRVFVAEPAPSPTA